MAFAWNFINRYRYITSHVPVPLVEYRNKVWRNKEETEQGQLSRRSLKGWGPPWSVLIGKKLCKVCCWGCYRRELGESNHFTFRGFLWRNGKVLQPLQESANPSLLSCLVWTSPVWLSQCHGNICTKFAWAEPGWPPWALSQRWAEAKPARHSEERVLFGMATIGFKAALQHIGQKLTFFFFFNTWKKSLIILLCNMFVNSDYIFYMTNTRRMLPFLLDGQRAFVSLALEDAAASSLMPGPWGGCYAVAVGKFWPGCSGDDCSWGSGFSSHLVLSTWSYVSSLLGTVSVSTQVSGYPISQQVPFLSFRREKWTDSWSIQYKFPL